MVQNHHQSVGTQTEVMASESESELESEDEEQKRAKRQRVLSAPASSEKIQLSSVYFTVTLLYCIYRLKKYIYNNQ